MKKDIHPNYGDATITCACGNVIKTRSTKKEMTVNTCSACHPYFTGQKTMVDTEGRVDSFKKRYAKFAKWTISTVACGKACERMPLISFRVSGATGSTVGRDT